jgi:hypothetical protein
MKKFILILLINFVGFGQANEIDLLLDRIIELEIQKRKIQENHKYFVKRDSLERIELKKFADSLRLIGKDPLWEQRKFKAQKRKMKSKKII